MSHRPKQRGRSGLASRLASRVRRWNPTLWALALSPTVWALHFLFCYVYAAIRCAKSTPAEGIDDVFIVIAAATVVALLLVTGSGCVAWMQARIEGDPAPHQQSSDEDRTRFTALSTFLLAALSFVAIIFTALPAIVFRDCR